MLLASGVLKKGTILNISICNGFANAHSSTYWPANPSALPASVLMFEAGLLGFYQGLV